MDREILFRGKRLDNGEWAEGFYMEVQHVKDKSHVHTFILQKDKCLETGGPPDFMVEVDPSTVGQYTGLTDKNGVKIFEWDMLYDPHENMIYIVEWSSEKAMFQMAHDWRRRNMEFSPYCEVIGNIHDNPELMGGDNDG